MHLVYLDQATIQRLDEIGFQWQFSETTKSIRVPKPAKVNGAKNPSSRLSADDFVVRGAWSNVVSCCGEILV